LDVLSRRSGLITTTNISLWQWIGPWVILLIIPAIIIPMTKQIKFLTLVSASILIIPYYLQADLLTLFIFPIGNLPIIIGYLPGILLQFYGYSGLSSGFVVPLFLYFLLITIELSKRINSKIFTILIKK
jgi:hypothetical protein